MMLLLGISKGMSILAVICLLALLIAYKLFSVLAAKPDQQHEKMDMLSRRVNHLEKQLMQINEKLEQIHTDTDRSSSDQPQENHD